jgi:transcriptional regulator with XRE-family HTH domain
MVYESRGLSCAQPCRARNRPYNARGRTLREVITVANKRKARVQEKTETIGERLARMRKERGITQQEMAELLSTSQPIVSDYERGELRLHGELIVKIAGILGVSGDELLGLERVSRSSAVSNRRLARRIQQIDQLPKRDQEALLRTIDAFLSKSRPESSRAASNG